MFLPGGNRTGHHTAAAKTHIHPSPGEREAAGLCPYFVSSVTSTSVGAVMGAFECPAVGSSVFSSPLVELITCREVSVSTGQPTGHGPVLGHVPWPAAAASRRGAAPGSGTAPLCREHQGPHTGQQDGALAQRAVPGLGAEHSQAAPSHRGRRSLQRFWEDPSSWESLHTPPGEGLTDSQCARETRPHAAVISEETLP